MEKKINLIGISGKLQSGKNTTAKIIQYLIAKKAGFALGAFDPSPQSTYEHLCGWQQKAYADKLKQVVSIITGISISDLNLIEIKNKELGEEWNRFRIWDHSKPTSLFFTDLSKAEAFCEENSNSQHKYIVEVLSWTPRKLFQTIGTDLFRDQIHPQVWINALFADYKGHTPECHSGNWMDSNVYTHSACTSCGKSFTGYKRQNICKECVERDAPYYPNWLVTDVRYPNEGDPILERGGLMLKVRRRVEFIIQGKSYWYYPEELSKIDRHMELLQGGSVHTHSSETAMDDYQGFHETIDNDSTLENLIVKVEAILRKYQII